MQRKNNSKPELNKMRHLISEKKQTSILNICLPINTILNLLFLTTTNLLDGSFGHMKTLLRNHRGVSKKKRFKIIEEILGK